MYNTFAKKKNIYCIHFFNLQYKKYEFSFITCERQIIITCDTNPPKKKMLILFFITLMSPTDMACFRLAL